VAEDTPHNLTFKCLCPKRQKLLVQVFIFIHLKNLEKDVVIKKIKQLKKIIMIKIVKYVYLI